ncbi:MAG: helix-turn-helix domain-containing protein [Actinomycetota bacterium]|nr:helix-turn-helix domain-containing protein [Actinomycetota bacterium]
MPTDRSARTHARPRDHVVVGLATGHLSPLELAIPAEVFGYPYDWRPSPWYDFRLASAGPDGEPISVFGGFDLTAHHGLDALEHADTVVVVPTYDRAETAEPVVEALRAAHARGARLVSICSGTFVLANAGLLDGRRATTHWWYTDELAARFPTIDVQPDVLFVDDGDVLTSAGSAAGIDLCLHLVRLDHGAAVANTMAKALVVPPHRDGGQAQYIDHPAVPDPVGHGLTDVMAWALEHLDDDLSVDLLAERAALSPRTFARRFRQEIGTTPHQWLTRQRIDRARHLLETTDLSVEQVAHDVGFGSAQSLRSRFKELVAIAPLDYRRQFRHEPAA